MTQNKFTFLLNKIDDIHHPLFQNKIQTTEDLILNSFKNEKVMSQTIVNVISKGMEYLHGLQQVIDIYESFSTIFDENDESITAFTSVRKSIAIQKEFLKSLVDWKIEMDIHINKHYKAFENNLKEYQKEKKTYDSEYSKLIKSKISMNEKAETIEKTIDTVTLKHCDYMNVCLWNFNQLMKYYGLDFAKRTNTMLDNCSKNVIIDSIKFTTNFKQCNESIEHPLNEKRGSIMNVKGTFPIAGKHYFYIKGKNLLVIHEKKGEQIVTNLITAIAKPQLDNHSFELITPNQRAIFSLSNNEEMKRWIQMIDIVRNNIENYTVEEENYINPMDIAQMIWKIPGNNRCAECGKSQPEWISLNLGVVVCLECSGGHRSLGVKVSRIRSMLMDKLDGNSMDIVKKLGNTFMNSIYQANKSGYLYSENTNGSERYSMIYEKYIEKKWCKKKCEMNIVEEITKGNLRNVREYTSITGMEHLPSNALSLAIQHNHPNIVTLLLMNGIDCNQKDENGNTSLHHCIDVKNDHILISLLRYCVDKSIQNNQGKTAFQLAEENQFSLGITLLKEDCPSEVSIPLIEDIENQYLSSLL